MNDDEVFEKRKVKVGGSKIFNNKKAKRVMIIAICVIILIILQMTLGIFSFSKGMGNTVGNILNSGYAAEDKNYIYYVSPSDDMATTNLSRVKKGSSEGEVIFEGDYDIRAVNIEGNHLYFMTFSTQNATAEDPMDNKIYQTNLDGSNPKVLNDNEFAYDVNEMYVINGKIYYIGEDYKVYSMDLNGKHRKLVLDVENGLLAISGDYIIYNKDNEDQSDYITYIRKINGSDERPVNGGRIFSPDIYNDYIYYVNQDQMLVKSPVKGGNEEVVLDKAIYNINIHDGMAYYLNYKDEENQDYTACIYRLSLNGGEPELLKELSYYASFLEVIDDYVYYMDIEEEKAFINLVNTKDKSEIKLHQWSYNN